VSRNTIRAVALVGAGIALLAVAGRVEAARHARAENRDLRVIVAAIGPLDNPSLDAYRVLSAFDCLLYKRAANPFALEVCVDDDGRVVEAIDRRGTEPSVATLREDPSASTVRMDRAEVERLIRRMRGTP
jgi:hypothetical protein